MSLAKATTWEERLSDLGNISTSRVRSEPAPGSASVEDVVRLRHTERRLYELVDGTLVEKAKGWQETLLAGVLLQWLNNYLDQHRLGVATGRYAASCLSKRGRRCSSSSLSRPISFWLCWIFAIAFCCILSPSNRIDSNSRVNRSDRCSESI